MMPISECPELRTNHYASPPIPSSKRNVRPGVVVDRPQRLKAHDSQHAEPQPNSSSRPLRLPRSLPPDAPSRASVQPLRLNESVWSHCVLELTHNGARPVNFLNVVL